MEKNTAFQWAFFKMSLIYGGVFFFWFFQNQTIQDAVNNGKVTFSSVASAWNRFFPDPIVHLCFRVLYSRGSPECRIPVSKSIFTT